MSTDSVYSPSQTTLWTQCPRLWAIQYIDGWKRTPDTSLDEAPPQLLGTWFGQAMESFNKEWQSTGHRPSAITPPPITTVTPKTQALLKAIDRMATADPVPSGATVLHVEVPRPLYGGAKADVVYTLASGERLVKDYKYTHSLDKRFTNARLEAHRGGAQRFHYCWMERATTFMIVLVVGQPFGVYHQSWVTTKEDVDRWLKSQQTKWSLMDDMRAGVLPIWNNDTHETKYGHCPLFEWCLEYGQDPSILPMLGYTKTSYNTTSNTTSLDKETHNGTGTL